MSSDATHRHGRRATALAAVAAVGVGAALVVGAAGTAPPAPPGRDVVATGAASPAPTAVPEPTAAPEPTPTPAATAGFAPVRIDIPALGVTAPMDPQVAGADNVLGVPADPRRLGWRLRGAQAAGAEGTLLAYGHVVNRGYGRGALYTLKNLAVGEHVVVTGADGRQATYAVISSERVHRDAMPVAELLATTGPHRLALYTCDGDPDATGHRQERIVVWASPVPDGNVGAAAAVPLRS